VKYVEQHQIPYLGLKEGMKCPSSLAELLRLNLSKSPIPGDHVKDRPARQFTSLSTMPHALPSSSPERKRTRTGQEGETEIPRGSQVLDYSVSESLPSSADFGSPNRDVTSPIGFSSVGSRAGFGDCGSPSPRDVSAAMMMQPLIRDSDGLKEKQYVRIKKTRVYK